MSLPGAAAAAGPGEGWHQYGDAWDACPVLPAGRLAWNVRDEQDADWPLADRAWQVYGRLVAAVGLVWGGAWGRVCRGGWGGGGGGGAGGGGGGGGLLLSPPRGGFG